MSRLQKIFRGIEFLLIFIGMPVVFYFNLLPIQKVVALLIVTLVCVLILWADSSYNMKKLFYRPTSVEQRKRLLVNSLVVAGSIAGLVLLIHPSTFLDLPRENTQIWLIIMTLYPLLSALPQELIYREFFFYRYEQLFPAKWALLLMSAASFSFLHIVYDNQWALLISFVGGVMFARTYQRTRSLYWVSVEHAIYGALIFTLGMRQYFYEGF
ncbi:MAG: CPBP family intramembrane glutamic endopeptidase [Balneolaceae bacterium]|nr:CPBP family intramembrane glutamic endopeptidase [Balneolaceae bacterium]